MVENSSKKEFQKWKKKKKKKLYYTSSPIHWPIHCNPTAQHKRGRGHGRQKIEVRAQRQSFQAIPSIPKTVAITLCHMNLWSLHHKHHMPFSIYLYKNTRLNEDSRSHNLLTSIRFILQFSIELNHLQSKRWLNEIGYCMLNEFIIHKQRGWAAYLCTIYSKSLPFSGCGVEIIFNGILWFMCLGLWRSLQDLWRSSGDL